MMKFAVKSAFLFLISLFVFSLVTRDVSAATVVSPINMSGWAFEKQTPDGVGDFVTGPSGQPLGVGSARLFTGTNGSGYTAIHRIGYAGTPIQNVTNLVYSSRSQSVASANKHPILIIDVSTNCTPDTISYSPEENFDTNNQAPSVGSWQTWNASSGSGVWRSEFFNNFSGSLAAYNTYVQAQPAGCAGPISLRDRSLTVGGVRLQSGPGGSGEVFDSSVDNFTIGINGSDTTYDFEPTTASNNFQQNFFSGNFGAPVGSQTTYTPPIIPNMGGFSWGLGSPAPGVPVDNFSARWTGTFNFEAAIYRFIVNTNNSNDTMRVFVGDADGSNMQMVAERTKTTITPMPPAPYVHSGASLVAHGALVPMTAGVHTVRIELVHTTGSSAPRFSFWKPADCRDLTADGIVNSGDQGIMGKLYGSFPSFVEQTGDNVTNSGDQLAMALRYGKTCPYAN